MEYGSAHYCVDLDGSIWELIPPDEMAYHVGADKYEPEAIAKTSKYPNDCTIGIELCVTNWAGDYTSETVASARRLVEFLGNSSRTIEWVMFHTNFPLGGWDCPRKSIYEYGWLNPTLIAGMPHEYVTVKSETMTPSGQILSPGIVCEINALDFEINQILIGCPAKKAQTWTSAANVEPLQ